MTDIKRNFTQPILLMRLSKNGFNIYRGNNIPIHYLSKETETKLLEDTSASSDSVFELSISLKMNDIFHLFIIINTINAIYKEIF